MKKKYEIGLKKGSLLLALCSLLLAFFAVTAYSADKLVVKDTLGNPQFVIKDDGKVGIGTENPFTQFSISASPGDTYRGLTSAQHSTNIWGAQMQFIKSRGTESSPQAVSSGDYLGFFHARGYDGTQYCSGNGHFGFIVDGTVSTGQVPIAFYVTTGSSNDWYTRDFYIKPNGYVGIGTTSPSYPLQMASGAYVTTGGVWTNASSREYKENIQDLSVQEALIVFNNLNPVKFNYKINVNEKHVGFIAEDVPDIIATKDRKGLSPMDIVAVLTRVVQDQQKTITELTQQVKSLEKMMKEE